MYRKNDKIYNHILIIKDLLLTIFSFAISFFLWVYSSTIDKIIIHQYVILGFLIIITWYLLIIILRIHNSQRIKSYSVILFEYLIINSLGILLLLFFIFALKLNFISRITILLFGSSSLILLTINRIYNTIQIKKQLLKGKNQKNTIFIADHTSIPFITKTINEKHWGLKIYGIYTSSPEIIKKFSKNIVIIQSENDLIQLTENEAIDEIIYCKNDINKDEIKNLIYLCEEIGINLNLQSDFFSLIASKSKLNYIDELPILTISPISFNFFALAVKSIAEYVFALFALIFFSPFYLIIALLIKSESKGEVLFKQERVGLRGRTFTMYKFRTMVDNAEELKKELITKNEADGPVFKIKNDPRITRIGKFLRKTSLDEFPQFINVIQGYMAVVGPRPPVPEEVALYERHQLRRLSMKPGITCIWQATDRNNSSFEEWVKLDLQYIDNWSLKLDFILIIKTIKAIFKRTGY
jgi:exopolysaccharide biosynthesis polyprenyl glycosylphosphotransferase